MPENVIPKKRHNNKPYVINGIEFYTITQFARKTNRTTQSVRNLISKGNRIRHLKVKRIAERPFIYASELMEYPFTLPGVNGGIYRFNIKGEMIMADEQERDTGEIQD